MNWARFMYSTTASWRRAKTSVPAGCFQVDAGVRLRPANSPLMLQMTFGYHYDSTNGKDLATGTGMSVPISCATCWRFCHRSALTGIRLASGCATILHPRSVLRTTPASSSKDAAGGIVEYGYSPNQQVTFGLRFVKIKAQAARYQFRFGRWRSLWRKREILVLSRLCPPAAAGTVHSHWLRTACGIAILPPFRNPPHQYRVPGGVDRGCVVFQIEFVVNLHAAAANMGGKGLD